MVNPIVKEFSNVGLRSLLDFEDKVNNQRMQEIGAGRYFYVVPQSAEERFQEMEDGPPLAMFEVGGEMRVMPGDTLADLLKLPREGHQFFSMSTSFSRSRVERQINSRSELLRMICDEDEISEVERTNRMDGTQLKDEIWPYYEVIKDNLTCRSIHEDYTGLPHPTEVMLLEALVIYWIKTGVPIDLSYMCFKIMSHAVSSPLNIRLPYGMRFSRLFRELGYTNENEYSVAERNLVFPLFVRKPFGPNY